MFIDVLLVYNFTLSIANDSRCVIPFILLPFIDNMRSPFRIRPSLSAGLPVSTLYTYKNKFIGII